MSKLDQVINDLIGREGGYVNNPNDRGGETIYGITEFTARAYGYDGPMKDLRLGTARHIYARRYWEEPRFNDVNELDSAVADELLDTGVLMGPATGVKFMQRALNVLNNGQKVFPDVVVDGTIGPMTISALRKFIIHRGQEGVLVLLRMMNGQQSTRLIEIAEERKTQEEFEYGWQLKRVTMESDPS